MSYTLFDLTYRVSRALGQAREGTATGGTTSTLIDINGRTEEIHYFKGGTLWLLYDAGGLGAAPEGEYTAVGDYIASSHTINFVTNMSVAPGVGDRYAIAKNRYPLWQLIAKVNEALSKLGPIPTVDITTITTETNKTEYSLPAGASLDLRTVHMATKLDSDDNRWVPVPNWDVQRTATGSVDKLVMPFNLPAGYPVKLEYVAPHVELHTYNAKLNETVHPDRITYVAAVACLNWYIDKSRSTDFDRTLARLQGEADAAELLYPVAPPPRKQRKYMLTENVFMRRLWYPRD